MPYTLSPEIEQMVREKIAAGEYRSEDEVLREAIWALDEISQRREELRSGLLERIAEADEKGCVPFDLEAFKLEARRRASQKA